MTGRGRLFMSQISKFTDLIEKKEYVSAAAAVLYDSSAVFAATVGLDGRPQVRRALFAFEQDGAFYFITLKSSRMYAELSKTPYVQFCTRNENDELTFRLSGKVCFTEEKTIIDRAAKNCPEISKSSGEYKKTLIAFFLLGAEAVLEISGEERKLPLPDPSGVLIGITIKKKNELRDRIARLLIRREEQPPVTDPEALRMFDGALLVFAEAAKALWPRMDIRPVERSAVFETYDEREKYTARAASIIGNAVINYPEDITYWLDPERWSENGFAE